MPTREGQGPAKAGPPLPTPEKPCSIYLFGGFSTNYPQRSPFCTRCHRTTDHPRKTHDDLYTSGFHLLRRKERPASRKLVSFSQKLRPRSVQTALGAGSVRKEQALTVREYHLPLFYWCAQVVCRVRKCGGGGCLRCFFAQSSCQLCLFSWSYQSAVMVCTRGLKNQALELPKPGKRAKALTHNLANGRREVFQILASSQHRFIGPLHVFGRNPKRQGKGLKLLQGLGMWRGAPGFVKLPPNAIQPRSSPTKRGTIVASGLLGFMEL